ncbi:MAG: hypothetical protein DI586_09310 [Micavibrio aeruginosavorus]|uniref:Prepilin-type N-terminal cleavage/methylation domain-containing protein n=1 Tax=Micavibrio aeruginosavorus TaxID=349221 RepID=A0A2W5FF50_9BACT|nr:MAG: hypothetical protein DI586_09310 [Micavibrio aeruginosavorus]
MKLCARSWFFHRSDIMKAVQTITKPAHRSAGFTLVELCIVIIILGVVISVVATGYQSWQKQVKVETNQARVATAAEKINEYKKIHGHFPQPASLTLPRGNAEYGYSQDKTSTPIQNAGACQNGFCAQNGVSNRKILIGALPFRDLNIPEEEAYDVYGSRIIYTVTEESTKDGFKENQGAIQVRNEENKELFKTDFPGVFLTFSVGKNGKGGYSRDGVLVSACTGTTADTANCDFLTGSATADFRSNAYSEASNDTGATDDYFDDIIAFNRLPEQSAQWRRGLKENTDESVDDLIATGEGNVYVGSHTRAPSSDDGKLSILYDSSKPDIYDGSMNIRGALKTKQLCDGTDCLGLLNLERTCGTGEYIIGFYNGQPQCGPVYFGCDESEYLTGVSSNGTPNCEKLPPAPKDGICGSANGTALTAAPTGLSACRYGDEGGVTESASGWSWSCAGTNGGGTANCSGTKVPPPYDGVCGSANNQTFAAAPPSSSRCAVGTESGFSSGSLWRWTCQGEGTGHTDASCSANKPPTTSCECGPGNCPTTTPPPPTSVTYEVVYPYQGALGPHFANDGIHAACSAREDTVGAGNVQTVSFSAPANQLYANLATFCQQQNGYCCQFVPSDYNEGRFRSYDQFYKYDNTTSTRNIAGNVHISRVSSLGTGQWRSDNPIDYQQLHAGKISVSVQGSAGKRPINGECGPEHLSNDPTTPTTGFKCRNGRPIDILSTGNNRATWKCEGTHGGTTAICRSHN